MPQGWYVVSCSLCHCYILFCKEIMKFRRIMAEINIEFIAWWHHIEDLVKSMQQQTMAGIHSMVMPQWKLSLHSSECETWIAGEMRLEVILRTDEKEAQRHLDRMQNPCPCENFRQSAAQLRKHQARTSKCRAECDLQRGKFLMQEWRQWGGRRLQPLRQWVLAPPPLNRGNCPGDNGPNIQWLQFSYTVGEDRPSIH